MKYLDIKTGLGPQPDYSLSNNGAYFNMPESLSCSLAIGEAKNDSTNNVNYSTFEQKISIPIFEWTWNPHVTASFPAQYYNSTPSQNIIFYQPFSYPGKVQNFTFFVEKGNSIVFYADFEFLNEWWWYFRTNFDKFPAYAFSVDVCKIY